MSTNVGLGPCPHCGKDIASGQTYMCNHCGARMILPPRQPTPRRARRGMGGATMRLISGFAILWLVVSGILIAAAGAVMAWVEAMRTDSCIGIECELRQLFLIVDLVGIAFGAAYVAAGIGLWKGRPRARLAGLVLALLGFLVTPFFFGILLPTDLGWTMSETGYTGVPEWPGMPDADRQRVGLRGADRLGTRRVEGSSATAFVTTDS